jgi:hypothetical protein
MTSDSHFGGQNIEKKPTCLILDEIDGAVQGPISGEKGFSYVC